MRASKPLTLFVFLLISCVAYSQSYAVDGSAGLSGQSNHANIMVVFERTAPSALYDTCYTDSSGHFSTNIEGGIYSVHYSKSSYLTKTLDNQAIYAATTLPNQVLGVSGISGDISGVLQSGDYTVSGDLTVPQGDTLIIEAGTKLFFMEDVKFEVNGLLLANGSEANKITFTRVGGSLGWGGLFVRPSADDNTVLSHCIVEYSKSDGVYFDKCSPTLINSTVRYNNGNAGIYLDAAIGGPRTTPKVINCIVSQNNGYMGGGIACINVNAEITNCLINDNIASHKGGGICVVYNCVPVIRNSTIVNNNPDGIGHYLGSSIKVFNSIVANNSGIGVKMPNGKIYNSNLYGNTTAVDNNDSWLGKNVTVNANNDSTDAYGNIQLDPLFTNHPLKTLSDQSPCIDAGLNDSISLSFDLMNQNRFFDGNGDLDTLVDMGATEYVSNPTSIVNTAQKDVQATLYPNPARDQFHIRLNTAEELKQITIYDFTGKVIHAQTTHETKVDVSQLKSGMYLVRIETSKGSHSKKLMLR